jgi:hypothetical protein
MNEKAILASYDLAVQNGYKKSIDEFKQLLSSNPKALDVSYNLALQNGYKKTIDDYKVLMGLSTAQEPIEKPIEVEKKNAITESPSEDGSLALSKSADSEALRFGKLASRIQQKPSTQASDSYATSPEFLNELEQAPIRKAEEDKKLAESKLIASKEFDKLSDKPLIEQSKYLNEQLTQINKDLIGKTEEYVVPEMEYRFGNLGFKFEEAEAGRDYMNVTAPNGKATQISLDNFLESTSASEALKLQKFIQDNTPQKGLFVLEKTLREQDKTFNSQKDVDIEAAKINQEATTLNKKQKDFILRKDILDKEVEELNKTPESQWGTPEFIKKATDLESRMAALNNELPTILSEEEALKKKASALDRSVGRYVSSKAKQGTWLGGIIEEFQEGFGSILADAEGRFIDITTEILPTGLGMGEDFGRQIATLKADKIGAAPPIEGQSMDDWKDSLTSKQLDAWEDEVDDAKKKFLKKDLVPAAREGVKDLTKKYVFDTNTTTEWKQLTKEGFWGGAILGLARSLPAMIGRNNPMGWVQRTSQMYAQVSDGLMQEMEKDPAFAEISESEKAAIIAPIGVVSSVLEAYGLRNVLQSKGIITSITMSVLGKAGRGVGNKSFRELVENEVTSRIARGALVLTAAGLAEGETGAAQEISETGFKAVYNMIKGDEYFKNPKTIEAFIKDVAVAGAQEAVGGFILGVPSSISSAYSKKGFLNMDDKTWGTFEAMANDGSLQSAYIISLKEKIASGKMLPSEAKEELQNYRTSVGLYRQLPDGLNAQQKKEAMNLLKEKKDLESYISGKDAALVSRQKDRINQINEELSKISEQGDAQVQAEANDDVKKRNERIAELSKAIEDDDTAIQYDLSSKLPTTERQKIEAELQTLKQEQDAIQEQAAGEVPVQSGATVSEEVAQGEPQAEPQVTAEAGVQEEVTPQVELTDDQIVEYNPTEEQSDKNNEVLGKVLKSKKFEPQAEPLRTDLGDSVVFEYNNFDENETRTRFTFKKKKDGTITGVGVKVENNVGDLRGTDLFRNYVASKRAAAPAVSPTVSPTVSPLTQEEQLAQMEQMFAEGETAQPDSQQEAPKNKGTIVSDATQFESLKNRVKDTAKKKIIDFAQKTLTTLKSVLPEFEIILHDDDNSYAGAMREVNGNADSAGYFSYLQLPDGNYVGRIDINLNKANNRTLAHEVAHGVMLKAFGENIETFKTFKGRVASVLSQSNNSKLQQFAKQYDEVDSYEEYLAELTATLVEQEGKLAKGVYQKIAELINELVSRITNGAFVPFQGAIDNRQAFDFFKNISESIRKGEAINPADITAIQEGLSVPIGGPTTINPAPKGKASINFTKTPLPLSFVTESDKIDINALIDDIVAKKQKIWFWMADQLGRGNYYDEVIEGQHYLDAGPSFALDPANRSKGILWASGLPEKTLTNQINQADYIFFISGSPEKAKLFNKRVLDLLAERINKTSNFDKFKEAINKFTKETVELRTIKDALNGVNSFKELADSPKRKPFLISIGEIGALKTAPAGSLKELLGSFNAFIDYNDLRDGFYKENGFSQNDIMLVGKPTGVSGKAPHSTYEFAISGEVVGVPDKKVDSWDIMPEAIKEKYKDVIGGREEKTKPMQTKVIAAETGVIRELEPRMKGKAQLIGADANLSARVKFLLGLAKDMESMKKSTRIIFATTGWEKGREGKWRYEIPDGKLKNFEIDDLQLGVDSKNNRVRNAKLGDIFIAPDLFQAYPEARNIKVHFKKLPPKEYGSYKNLSKTITINQDLYEKDKDKAELTLLHEIQHYIQYVELFETGSNPESAKTLMVTILDELKNKITELKENKSFKKAFPETYNENLNKLTSAYNNVFTLSRETPNKYEKEQQERILEKINEEEGLSFTVDELFPRGNALASAYNLYYRVAGEVEARNVEARNKLTPSQRKKVPFSFTEDVDKADQILFDNAQLILEGDVDNLSQQFKGKAQLDTDAKAKKVVQQARAQGFSEDAIKLFLEGKGLSREAIANAMAKETPAAGRITLSEETIPGYNSLMKRIARLIEGGMSAKEVISKLKNSKTYLDATDVQKETLVREVQKKLGLRQRSAPRAGRLIGEVNDVTKITMTEKELLKKRLKDLNEGAKDAVKAWRKTTSDLAKEIKQLATSGKLTLKQVTRVISRLGKLNAFNEKAVNDFIDYMANVFADAEYRDVIDGVKRKLSRAKKNIASKIGIADTLRGPLNKLLSINPLLIPEKYLDRYVEIVNMFGANEQVLTLELYDFVKSDTDAILRAINEEQSRALELADVLENSENQVVVEGKLDYAATLNKMVKEGEIDEKDAELMRKYKKDIVPQVESTKLSEDEIKEKKQEAIKTIKETRVDGIAELPSEEERKFAQEFADILESVSVENLMKLSLSELKNLIKTIDNIKNGYLTAYAYQIAQRIEGVSAEKVLDEAAAKASPPKVSAAIAKIKNLVTDKGALLEAIKRIPLFNIDQVLGNFKGKEVFNALLLKTAQAETKFKTELKRINSILEKAEQNVAKSFSLNQNKIVESKMKMMAYMIQLEYESNQGNEQVNPASEYIQKTIDHINKGKTSRKYGQRDVKLLTNILNEYSTDGQIDIKKLYDSFNQAEKDAVNDVRKINEGLKNKAEFTSSIIRGDVFDGLNNYVHLNVLNNGPEGDIRAANDIVNMSENNLNPSTKAKSLIKRTKGAKPINFDIFSSASRGAKYVLLDYHLTRPIRTARIALNQLEKTLDGRKNVTKLQREVSNALNAAYNEAVNNLLVNSIMEDSLGDQIVNYIGRMGYRSVLAGTGRFAAELTSNISFALIANPQSFTTGVKYANIIMSPMGPSILENTSSTQSTRIYPEDDLSAKFMDTSAMGQRIGMGSRSKNPVINKVQQLWNLTGKRYTNAVEALADNMISTPDKIVIRSIWFGSFANEFKKATGKEVDFKLIAENNEKYLRENKDAIDKARAVADQTSVQTGATDNAFMGILKGVSKPNQKPWLKIYNNFNSYMTRFLIFEYMSARTGVYAMMGEGMMTRTQGAMLLAAVATRMTVYSLLSRMLADGILGLAYPLFGIEDEEEEEESFLQRLGQAFAGSFGSLFFGRDFGNAIKLAINLGLEEFNEEYLGFLREGEYDQYEDAIAYSIIPRGKEDKKTLDDFLFRMGGSFGPALQTSSLIFENYVSGSIPAVLSGETTKKEADAIERESRVVKERIPLEILGNLGFVPLYKDVRRAALKSIYSDLEKSKVKVEDLTSIKEKSEKIKDLRALKEATTDEDELRAIRRRMFQVNGTPEQKESVKNYNKIKKDRRERLLYDSENSVRYDNESEMKRYNPKLYKERFGVGSEWYEKYKADNSIESKLSKVTRKREDEEYGYKK